MRPIFNEIFDMKSTLLFSFFLVATLVGNAQYYDMTDGTFEVCKGFFRDPGGEGSYTDDLNIQTTFCSANGGPLKIVFNSFVIENNFDDLLIYDGNDTSGLLLGTYTGTLEAFEVCSNQGCLTLVFSSDGSITGPGWEAQVFCSSCEDEPAGDVILISEGIRHSTCNSLFYDSGHLEEYEDDEYYTQTICSAQPGEALTMTLLQVDIEEQYDYLTIHDGPLITDVPLAVISGVYTAEDELVFCSASGCLTLEFTSDGSITRSGWEAQFSCEACSDGPTGEVTLINDGPRHSTCDGLFYDSGFDGNYSDNEDYTHTICTSQPGDALVMTILQADIEQGFDNLYIHDGPQISETPLANLSGVFGPSDSLIYCSDTGCITVEFNSDISVTRAGWEAVFSCQYNCAGDDYPKDTTIVSVQEPIDSKIYSFPNPFQNEINLAGIKGNEQYQLFDQRGALIQEGQLYNSRIEVSNNLSRGVYTMVVYHEPQPLSIRLIK